MDAVLDWSQPYPSARAPVFARDAIATSHPLATAAGMAMFDRGGNAVDAIIAAAAALPVVEPTNNGIGSDAFAIVSVPGEAPAGLNSSGRSPAALDVARLTAAGRVGPFGWDAVTVPGAVAAWGALSDRYGRLSFDALLEPAIGYARAGVAAAPRVSREWAMVGAFYEGQSDFARTFLPNGRAPEIGETFHIEGLADTLESLAATRGRSLYDGDLADRLVAHARATGGVLSEEDLGGHRAAWVAPMSVDYGEWSLLELPPNGQGLAALVALAIVERVGVHGKDPDSAAVHHLQVEAMKIGVEVAARHVGDPDLGEPVDRFLEPSFIEACAARIDAGAAAEQVDVPATGDTVYLCAGDRDGRLVSYIQSNYFAFGSGIVVPGAGISLQNRGAGFVTEAGHPNCVAASKRPFQTIIPAMACHRGEPAAAFGVMGGPMQPQGHLQLFLRMAQYGQNPQAAIDAPRWQTKGGRRLAVERGAPEDLVSGLAALGHECVTEDPYGFGGAQAVLRYGDGLAAASDPRKDGHAAGR